MKLTRHLIKFTVIVFAIFIFTTSAFSDQGGVKYVFYFIGDGMATIQIHAAEVYLASLQAGYNDSRVGIQQMVKLNLSKFPSQGMITTYADDRFITDSAAAGTALATGHKTACGVVSLSTDRRTSYVTIAEKAKAKGMKVGIITSVSVDHATPAVFYAHEVSRDNYFNIGMQLANSDFDYFAGGSLKQPRQRRPVRRRGNPVDVNNANVADAYQTAKENGFTITTSRQELNECKPGQRVIAYNKAEERKNALYYDIDRPDDCMSLAEFTAKGIELLDNENGFFMMVEGGKIDWACHANDAMTSIIDTIAFDKAVTVALDFYGEHPDETIIVVAADHETGGMSMGFAATEYSTAFEILKNQKMSFEKFDDDVWSKYTSGDWSGIEDNIPDQLKQDIEDAFGLVYNRFNPFEKKMLEDAYDKAMAKEKKVRLMVSGFSQQDSLLYGTYNPVSVTLTHLLNNKAGIAWTSYAHTGAPVEVHAIGVNSHLFNGFYDNTDVPKRLAVIMQIELD